MITKLGTYLLLFTNERFKYVLNIFPKLFGVNNCEIYNVVYLKSLFPNTTFLYEYEVYWS